MIEDGKRRVERLAEHRALAGFSALLEAHAQSLDDHGSRMGLALGDRIARSKQAVSLLALRLSPRHLLEVIGRRRDAAAALDRRLLASRGALMGAKRDRLVAASSLLHSLSPLAVLDRGYALCLDGATGRVLRDSTAARVGDAVSVRLAKGALDCHVVLIRSPQEDPS